MVSLSPLAVAVLAVPVVGSQDSEVVPLQRAHGRLRHAVLLDVEPERHVTLATSARTGSRTSRLEFHRIELGEEPTETELGAPLDSIDFPFDLLWSTEPVRGISCTWLCEPGWSVDRVGDHWRCFAVDPGARQLHVVDTSAKRRPLVVEDVDRLLDSRSARGGHQCLVANGGHASLLEIGEDLSPRQRYRLTAIEGEFMGACFPTEVRSGIESRKAVVVAWKDGSLLFDVVDLASVTSFRTTVEVGALRPAAVRVTAWFEGSRGRIAVGLPGDWQDADRGESAASGGFGRVVVVELKDEEVRLVHEHDHESTFSEERRGRDGATVSSVLWEFGTTVTFVADRDDDSVPDLVVGAPTIFVGTKAYLYSTDGGQRLASYGSTRYGNFGACPTADSTGRYLLVTGPTNGSPESLRSGSSAVLFDLASGRRPIELIEPPSER